MKIPFETKELVILELSNEEIKLIAQLLHIHVSQKKETPLGHKALESLILQSDVARKDPIEHKVYLENNAPVKASLSPSVWYISCDD